VTSWTGKRRNDAMSRTACWWVMGAGLHSEDIDGCKSFGAWPLTQAAKACFGTPDWPVERPVPQASVEFEVADAETVQVAADELKEKGFTLLHDARTEPWDRPSLDCSPARVRSSASPTRPLCISSKKERCPVDDR
jgi:hypothetical protein